MDQYDTLTHLKTSSPQPLLSDSDPAYGKLGQVRGTGVGQWCIRAHTVHVYTAFHASTSTYVFSTPRNTCSRYCTVDVCMGFLSGLDIWYKLPASTHDCPHIALFSSIHIILPFWGYPCSHMYNILPYMGFVA